LPFGAIVKLSQPLYIQTSRDADGTEGGNVDDLKPSFISDLFQPDFRDFTRRIGQIVDGHPFVQVAHDDLGGVFR